MKFANMLRTALVLGTLGVLLVACKKEDAPGPAEAVGKQIDSAFTSANEQATAAASKAQESMKDSTSTAGQKIDEAVESAKSTAKELAQKAGEKIQSAGKKIEESSKDAQK